jgi:hypothetical protein
VALPPVAIALVIMVMIGMGGGFVPLIVWPPFLVLGGIWTYEIASRIMGGRLDQHRFSVAAVSIGATGGFLAGMLMMITQTLCEPPVLAFVGAFLGTFVPAKAPDPRPDAGSDQ